MTIELYLVVAAVCLTLLWGITRFNYTSSLRSMIAALALAIVGVVAAIFAIALGVADIYRKAGLGLALLAAVAALIIISLPFVKRLIRRL